MAKAVAKKTKVKKTNFNIVHFVFGGIFLTLLLVLAFYFKIYIPFTVKYEELNVQSVKLDGEISDLNKKLKAQEEIQRASEVLEASYNFYLKFLPKNTEIQTLLRRITDNASQTGLVVNIFQPSVNVELTPYFATQAFNIQLEGPYLSVVQFLYNISIMQLIVSINEVKISLPKRVEGMYIVKVNATGSTYRVLSDEEIKEQAEKEAAAKAKKTK